MNAVAKLPLPDHIVLFLQRLHDFHERVQPWCESRGLIVTTAVTTIFEDSHAEPYEAPVLQVAEAGEIVLRIIPYAAASIEPGKGDISLVGKVGDQSLTYCTRSVDRLPDGSYPEGVYLPYHEARDGEDWYWTGPFGSNRKRVDESLFIFLLSTISLHDFK